MEVEPELKQLVHETGLWIARTIQNTNQLGHHPEVDLTRQEDCREFLCLQVVLTSVSILRPPSPLKFDARNVTVENRVDEYILGSDRNGRVTHSYMRDLSHVR